MQKPMSGDTDSLPSGQPTVRYPVNPARSGGHASSVFQKIAILRGSPQSPQYTYVLSLLPYIWQGTITRRPLMPAGENRYFLRFEGIPGEVTAKEFKVQVT